MLVGIPLLLRVGPGEQFVAASVTRRRVRSSPSGVSVNSTSIELPATGSSPRGWFQRNEKRVGGSTVSTTTVALPAIGRELRFPESDLQWVVTAYGLTFAGFLLLGGRAADLLGRRRILMAGLAVFTAASFGGGLATSDTFLIVMRGMQGLGAALVLPAACKTAWWAHGMAGWELSISAGSAFTASPISSNRMRTASNTRPSDRSPRCR